MPLRSPAQWLAAILAFVFVQVPGRVAPVVFSTPSLTSSAPPRVSFPAGALISIGW